MIEASEKTAEELAALVRRRPHNASAVGRLTPAECEVFVRLLDGMETARIAAWFAVTTQAVDAHRWKILRKFSVANVAALVRKVFDEPYPGGGPPALWQKVQKRGKQWAH